MDNNNKRIVKNSVFLYLRMLIVMCVSFFTTRVVLEKLGASDYGIYNVVGGFVSMFTILNSILQTGTNRFFALNLASGDKTKLKKTFSTAFVIHLLIALIVFVALESIGLWFLNHKLNIPEARMATANWVFQTSVVCCMLGITQTPYSAAITANEKFDIYAMLSVLDVVVKLLIVYLLVIITSDKLLFYAILMMLGAILNITLNRIYCVRHFDECRFSLKVDKRLFREMLSFSGWATVGHLSAVLNGQGINVLLNIFFGTVINAARGLATTVTFTVKQFVGGFTTAAVPQLVKFYGSGEKEKFVKLVFNISQVTLFMLAIFIVPVMLEIDYVLKLWLGKVPEFTSAFIRISLFLSFLSYSNYMIDQAVNAIGRVKELNLWSTPLYLLDLPLSYLVLRLGGSPATVYWVSTIPMVLAMLVNIYLLKRYYGFPAVRYLMVIVVKNLFLIMLASIIPFAIKLQMNDGLLRFLIVCLSSVVLTGLVFWFMGLNASNRLMIKTKVLGKIVKMKLTK